MPLFKDAADRIRANLTSIKNGDRVSMITIGMFTDDQFLKINTTRSALNLPALESNEIIFIGRHVYNSRSKDGYSIEDIVIMIDSALHEASVVIVNKGMSAVQNMKGRQDGYGNTVRDRAVFEMYSRRPRAELLSVSPKGDNIKPLDAQKPA